MFYGLLLDVSSHSIVSKDDSCPKGGELDATWFLGLEAWVQLSVFSLLPGETRVVAADQGFKR